MKKIVCIVNYTRESENAVQYAARLAQDTSSKLVLATLQNQHASKGILAFAGDEDAPHAGSTRLPELCDRVRGMWKIPCAYQESLDVEHEHEFLKSDIQLMVMGIQSSSEATSHTLAANIDFRMIQTSHIPVLLVPDSFEYQHLNRLLYAYDYAHELTPPIDQLKDLVEWLHVDLRFLSVVEKKYSLDVEAELEKRNVQIFAHWKSSRNLSFDYIYYTDVKKCINHYLDLWRADDIVIFSMNHPTFTHRLFHKSVIREMTVCSNHPMMIIHK